MWISFSCRSTGACRLWGDQTAQKLAKDAKELENENFDTDLTFNSVTLEDFDRKGNLWWKVKAEQATYSRDNKIARVKNREVNFIKTAR